MKFEEVKAVLMWEVLPSYNKSLAICKGEDDLKTTTQLLIQEIAKIVFPSEHHQMKLFFQP
jgi:hypothetical protein